ncbi:MAG: helix-hairpin-helix domain-containing protein [Candidatus Coatesbacteria bacterium]|nr:helix-hairpin-helix domain-containing protein [Candidatus Coatesbacteria bacterium]
MKEERFETECALIALAAILLGWLAWSVIFVDGEVRSADTRGASIYLTRDGWLGAADFETDAPYLGKATLEIFDQLKVRPNFATASKALFMAVDGIGPSLSDAIIEFRDQRGGNVSPKDLLEIPGIGEKRLRSIQRMLDFGPANEPPAPVKIDL